MVWLGSRSDPAAATSSIVAVGTAFILGSSTGPSHWNWGWLGATLGALSAAMAAIWLIAINIHRNAGRNAALAPRWYRFVPSAIVLVVASLCIAYVAAHVLIFVGGCRLRITSAASCQRSEDASS